MNLWAMKRGIDEIHREGRNKLAELCKNPSQLAYYLALADQKHRAALKEAAAMHRDYERRLEDIVRPCVIEIAERMQGQSEDEIVSAVMAHFFDKAEDG